MPTTEPSDNHMQVKTFTALITVAVEDGKQMPHEFSIGELTRGALEGRMYSPEPLVEASFVSVIPGDALLESQVDVRQLEGMSMSELFNLGCRIESIKRMHAHLCARVSGSTLIQHPGLNEGSDND